MRIDPGGIKVALPTEGQEVTYSGRLVAVGGRLAVRNRAYAVLEAEARIAALAVGLDPGLGVLHADLKARDSLALDLMEAARPAVDGWVLDALAGRAFAKADFFETREGTCRLMPPLAKAVAEAAPRWAADVAPVAEGVARLPTPREATPPAALPPACRSCGFVLEGSGRDYCDECLPERRAEQAAGWAAAGGSALARRRSEGADPAHGGEAGRKRGERNAEHVAAVAAWERDGGDGTDAGAFTRDILPQLQAVPLRLMAEATGLSEGYCSLVRRGQKVPHRRHWAALARLGEGSGR